MEFDGKMIAAVFAAVTSLATAIKVLWSQFMASNKKARELQDGYIEELAEDRNRYRDELLPAIENVTDTLRSLKSARDKDREVYLEEIAPAIKELQQAVTDLKDEAGDG